MSVMRCKVYPGESVEMCWPSDKGDLAARNDVVAL